MDEFDQAVAARRRQALLAGVVLPASIRSAAWVLVVERLMSRGVTTPAYLADLLEQPVASCEKWIEAVRQRWQNVEVSEVAAERREELYQRTMAIGDMAIQTAMGLSDSNGQKTHFMRVALQANEKAAALAGVNKVTIEVKHDHTLTVRKPSEVLGEFGLAELRDLGAMSAAGMREQHEQERLLEEGQVVDVEFEPVEELVAVEAEREGAEADG